MEAETEAVVDTKTTHSNNGLVPAEPVSYSIRPVVDNSIVFTSTVYRDPDDFEAFRM